MPAEEKRSEANGAEVSHSVEVSDSADPTLAASMGSGHGGVTSASGNVDPSGQDPNAMETLLFPDLSLFDEPVDEEEPRPAPLSDWAKSKIGTFQSRLEMVLQSREKKGYKMYSLSQVSSSVLIKLVNESFGFNGWSSSVLDVETLSQEEDVENQVFSAKRKALIRISLRDGTSIEAQGFGESTNQPHKYLSLSNSSKLAITNGIRNAILQFTDLLNTGTSIKLEPL